MPIDTRREMKRVWKEYDRYYSQVGEDVIWFMYDTISSEWDPIYDEGGKTFGPPIRVPALWVDQIEDPEQYSGEGRRPTQRFRFAVSAAALQQRGIDVLEAHGNAVGTDLPPVPGPGQVGRPESPWRDDRLNDVVWYDNRFYSISNFQIRGRMKSADLIVGVSAIEMDPNDEAIQDVFPWSHAVMGGGPPEDEFDRFDLRINKASSAVLELDVSGQPNLGESTWTCILYEGSVENPTRGGIVASWNVDVDAQDAGQLTLTLPLAQVLGLVSGYKYQWILTQYYPGTPKNEIAGGNVEVE